MWGSSTRSLGPCWTWGENILELSQTVIRSYFTIILEVEFPVTHSARQLADTILDRGKRFDPQVLVAEVRNEILKPAVPSGERFILTVLGDDSPP